MIDARVLSVDVDVCNQIPVYNNWYQGIQVSELLRQGPPGHCAFFQGKTLMWCASVANGHTKALHVVVITQLLCTYN